MQLCSSRPSTISCSGVQLLRRHQWTPRTHACSRQQVAADGSRCTSPMGRPTRLTCRSNMSILGKLQPTDVVPANKDNAARDVACAAAADGRARRQLSFDSMTVQGGMENDLLWAGYSEHSEQLRRLQLQNERLLSTIDDLHSKVAALQQQQQQQPPSASLWQAASFLLFFLGFINCCSLVAQFNLGLFLPWGMAARGSGTAVLAKQLLGVVLPLTNTAVVLVMCAQAIRAAVTCLRF